MIANNIVFLLAVVIGFIASFNTVVSARMTDSLADDVAYLLGITHMAIFAAASIYTMGGSYELVKCKQLDSPEVAGAISMALFLASGLLIVTVVAY